MSALVARLRDRESMILVGAAPLGLLPLHAAWTAERSRPACRRYALDYLAIKAAPSAAAARLAARFAREAARESIAVIADSSIPGTTLEARYAASTFTESTVLKRAQRSDVLSALAAADVWHFACHAKVAYDAMENALMLRRTEPLTIRDILSLPLGDSNPRLAVLSACETAIIDGDLPDEAVSLATSVLRAGVAGVIGSLWAVSAGAATPMLMARFYELWRCDKLEPPEALRQAQRWLRDATNAEKHLRFPRLAKLGLAGGPRARSHAAPYYWAAFTYYGA